MGLTSTLRYKVLLALIFSVCMGIWHLSGQKLHGNVIYQNQLSQLGETGERLTQRVEKAIDFAVSASAQILFTDISQCDDALHQRLRDLVAETGSVLDIYIVTQTGTCSAFDETSVMLPDFSGRSEWYSARNPLYRIGVLYSHDTELIGVSRGLGTMGEIVFLLNPDALLYGALPTDILPYVETALFIGHHKVNSDGGAMFSLSGLEDMVTIHQTSVQYPVSVRIRADVVALRTAHKDVAMSVFLPWWVLGTFLSVCGSIIALRWFNPKVADIKHALKSGQIRPHFQPIVETISGQVLGCEALARWVAPDGEITSPAEFIPVIEQNGLDDLLLTRMLLRAKQDLRYVLEKDPSFYISFNVTPAQISRFGFANDFVKNLQGAGLRAEQVCVEITERQVISDPDMAAINAADLRAAGLRLAIDDAGTGHNGLASMQLLNVCILKIDKFFVDHISADPRSRIMLDTFVSVAKKSNMKTVAEGVEELHQMSVLKAAGVTSIQGHFFSKALPGSEFTQLYFGDWAIEANQNDTQKVVNF